MPGSVMAKLPVELCTLIEHPKIRGPIQYCTTKKPSQYSTLDLSAGENGILKTGHRAR